MKIFRKALATFIFIIGTSLIYSPDADAQFFKKLSKGLEKVNKSIEKANEFLEGNTSSAKKKSETTPSEESTEQPVVTMEKDDNVTTLDDSSWDDAKPIYNTPYITSKTRFLSINEYDKFSDVHNGIFALQTNTGITSFWKITGEQLFEAEWKYCGSIRTDEKFPLFIGGVAPALRTVPNAKGTMKYAFYIPMVP